MSLVPGIKEKGGLALRGAAMVGLIPDRFDTDQQFDRFHHYDLPSLETEELWHELHALRSLLWWRLPGDPWLQERIEAIEAELAKRRNWRGQGVRGG